MRCPTCHASAPDGSRYCPSCGRTLRETAGPASPFDAQVTMAAGDIAGATIASDAALRTFAASPEGERVPGPPSSEARFPTGALLANRYRIVGPLGRGGMGEVYRAADLRLGQEVALKVLPPSLAHDPTRLAQFHSEVRLARQISHPNVCRVYDIGDVDGDLFLSMEYVEGEDLAAALRRVGRFPEPEAVEITRQICAGLASVHERGVLHRDLKPANIMLSRVDGRVRLMDFGLASGVVETPTSRDGIARVREGTPAYMAPEQFLGEPLTVRSDIYALGLVMHELFTGRPAFEATTLGELVTQRTTGAAIPSGLHGDGLNPRIAQAIQQCLARDPAQRPESAQRVSALLQTVLLDASTTPRRLVQAALLVTSAVLLMNGPLLAWRGQGSARSLGIGLTIAAAGLLVAVLRFSLGWDVSYNGHRIRFRNHPLFGERLYIDDVLVDRGRPGMHITLRGTIESGAGAGERITAESHAGLFTFSCRIVAESFAAAAKSG